MWFYSSPAIFLCIECVRVKRRAILITCCQHGPLVIAAASRARASLRHRCWFKRICCVKIRPLDNFQFMLKSLVITCKHEKASRLVDSFMHQPHSDRPLERARPVSAPLLFVCCAPRCCQCVLFTRQWAAIEAQNSERRVSASRRCAPCIFIACLPSHKVTVIYRLFALK